MRQLSAPLLPERRLMIHALHLVFLFLFVLSATAQPTLQTRSPHRESVPRTIPSLSTAEAEALSPDTVGLPFFDNMEKGPNGWVRSGFMHLITNPQRIQVLTPDINPRLVLLPDSGKLPIPHSGVAAWWYGEDSTGTFIGNDFDRTQPPLSGGTSRKANSGTLISPPIDLTKTATATLTFYTWWEIEGVNSDQFDVMLVEVSVDGGISFQLLGSGALNPLNDPNGASWKAYSSGGLGIPAVWTNQLFDLTPFIGKVVLLRFRFETGDQRYNGFRGWFIDDVSVSGTPAPAPVITSVSPRNANSSSSSILTIRGQNFANGASVSLNNTAPGKARTNRTMAPIFLLTAVVSSSQADVEVPLFFPTGKYDLVITNPDAKSFTFPNAITVTDVLPPSINSITPDSTIGGSSVQVTIRGTHFKQGVTVEIGGTLLQNLVLVDSLTIKGNSPPNLPTGLHNVKVINPDGQYDLLVSAFKIVAPSLAIDIKILGDTLAGNNLGMTITPPTGFAAQTGSLHYRQAGTQKYDSLALTLSNGKFTCQIPSSVMDIRGVEYFITLSDATGGVITHPPINPVLRPTILRVKAAATGYPLPLQPETYRMVSVPIEMNDTTIAGFFGGDYGEYNKSKWRVFRWEGGMNVEYPAIQATFSPGHAFWLVTRDGTPFTARNGVSVMSSQLYAVILRPGWNQIANPFAFPVNWAAVNYPGRPGILRGIYRYDGVEYSVTSGSLIPWEGYFVKNDSSAAITLSFPPLEAGALGKSANVPSPVVSDRTGCTVQFSATIPGTSLRATQTLVGLRQDASDAKDIYDYPQPPPIVDALHLVIRENGETYLRNLKSSEGEGKQWLLQVSAPVTKRAAVITPTVLGVLPPGFEFIVLDKDNENVVQTAEGTFAVEIPSPAALRTFIVILGTRKYAEEAGKGIPLQPFEFSLDQNFPNPFNPETTIRYRLAGRSAVTLEIYDILGQQVRTLVNTPQTTGEYSVAWNGTNDSGKPLASGVYLCRLRANEFTAVRKLLLVR